MKTHFEIWRSVKSGRSVWYWHAKRGRFIVADGAEGYSTKAKLLKSLRALLASIEAGKYSVKE